MQRPFNACPVVRSESAEATHHRLQIIATDGNLTERQYATWESGLRNTAKIKHNLQQLIPTLLGLKSITHRVGKKGQQPVEIVGDPLSRHVAIR